MTKKKHYSRKAKKIKKSDSRSNGRMSKARSKFLINKKMKFSEILKKYPEAAEILMNKGMHCFGCCMAADETLEQGAIMHGLNPDKLVEEINRKIGKK
jgi:hybrid cluster-associated redox disulfide protein